MNNNSYSSNGHEQPTYVKLRYIGKMDVPGWKGDTRLWNIVDARSLYNRSTRTLAGLKELKIVPMGDNRA